MTTNSNRLSPQDLSLRLSAEESPPLMLDVRTSLEHREMNLDGAQLLPLDQLDAPEFARQHGADRECVVICRSGSRSEKAAKELSVAGMNRVKVLEGGLNAWADAGLPLNRGKKTVSLERQVRIAAGFLVVFGIALGFWVHPGFYGISAFVGCGLMFAGITDWCGMGLLLAKAPWNKVSASEKPS